MEQDTWTVLDSYFRDNENFLTKHHLHSFDDFIQNKIPATIKSLNPFIMLKNDASTKLPKHEVRIFVGGESGDKIYFIQPQHTDKPLLPNVARLKGMTYKADLLCDISIKYITYDKDGETIKKEKTVTMDKIRLGAIPIMLKSCLCYLYKQPHVVLKEFGECPYDQGGYMVVDGKEKVIVAQERIATNRLFINKSPDPDYSFKGLLRCTIEDAAVFPKTIKIGVYKTPSRKNSIVFSLPNIDHEICLFTLFRALGVENDRTILSHIVGDVDDPENSHLLNFLYYSMRDGAFVYSQQHALEYLASFVKYNGEVDYVQYVLLNDFFPNLNEGRVFEKPLLLGHITKHIVQVCLGLEKESERDSYSFKRVDISGFLLSNLFRDFYNKFRNTCRSEIDKLYNYGPYKNDDENFDQLVNPLNMWQVFDQNIIGNGIVRSLKASWGVEKDSSKQGAVQDLNRISFIGYASHVRRVNTPIDRSIKIVAPHRLHATQWGMMCPCETPDGASIGLLKNFAMLCHITFDCKSSSIVSCLKELGVYPLSFVDSSKINKDICKVMINSTWYGITQEPANLVNKLRLLRRNSLINVMTSIAWNIKESEIYINTEAGRCCRPIYIVKNNSLLIKQHHIQELKTGELTWHDLIKGKTRDSFELTDSSYYSPKDIFKMKKDKSPYTEEEIWKQLERNQSVIEFIDVEETENCLIAMHFDDLQDNNKSFTHAEIHPSTIFAVLTANIPFANHNQAPRNYFSGAQGKQAIGVYSSAFNNRMDTAGLVLYYPQRRVVNTRYMHYIGNNDMPSGENTIVAIMTYTGFNQEDSVIINKSAIERGLFNLTYYKTITESEDSDKNGNDRVIFINPQKQKEQGVDVNGFGKRFANYSKLDENGLPIKNMKIEEGDVYIGKCLIQSQSESNENDNDLFKSKSQKETWKDKSLIADKTMSGTIDKVYVYDNAKGHKGCKIRLRKVRIPVLGDKTGSNHAQKGVIGMIVPHENMPYTKDGIVPDIIINPHAIPTRMTIGHLLECIFAKTGCLEGDYLDATPFCYQNIDKVYDRLEKMKYDRYGNEIMYNGINGEQINTEIFIGPTYYIRMKHMVQDKINYRSNEGGYVSLTRQPVKSRAKGGGLRIGEMETNTVLSHGMAAFLRESLMDRADKYETFVEQTSGSIIVSNNKNNYAQTADEVSRIQMPYAAKTFCQELEAMSICPRLVTDTNEFYDQSPNELEIEWETDFDNFHATTLDAGQSDDE